MTLRNSILDAQEAAIQLFQTQVGGTSPADFAITGTAVGAGGASRHFPYPRTENWQKAIGAHWIWLSSDIHVRGTGPLFQFEMFFTLHAEDRYNFNPGSMDIATGAPDSLNGELEVSGLAQQYMNYSTLTRHITWNGLSTGSYDATGSPDRRVRQPSDNRRLRTRL
jgi:hypothetical protein